MRYAPGSLYLIDQRRLPHEETWLELGDAASTARAIRDMVVRGAPAIAITAAYGLALAARRGEDRAEARRLLLASRPTAVNLRWALERLDPVADADLEEAARDLHAQDVATNRAMGDRGARILPDGGIYTHCNTGALATGGWGTALGIVRSKAVWGRTIHVYVGETRPYLQGARLTTWECVKEGIACTLVTDSMAAALFATGRVGSVVVGCDRVAANGDVANKIGTLALAILARHHGLPFYVAMPLSTLDLRCPDGDHIPIEERAPSEVLGFRQERTAPAGVDAWNPAFDVTPAELVTGWITEEGAWTPG